MDVISALPNAADRYLKINCLDLPVQKIHFAHPPAKTKMYISSARKNRIRNKLSARLLSGPSFLLNDFPSEEQAS